jgi:outer membrane protein assembly factor BamB
MIWKCNVGSQIVSSPAVGNGSVYFGTTGGDVVSANVKSGKEQWRFKTGGAVPSSPCIAGTMVYVGSNDHHVYALPA